MPQFEIKKGIAIIPVETTKVDDKAFIGSTSLESVVIPIGVTKIGEYAFYCCTSLTTVILPFSVDNIGKGAFERCSALTAIYVPAKKFDHYKDLFPTDLHDMIKPVNKDMEWDEAIQKVLADYGRSMRYMDILKKIIKHGYRLNFGDTPVISIGGILRSNVNGWFENDGKKGLYKLVDTPTTTLHIHRAEEISLETHRTVESKVPVVVRPCSLYKPGDSAYKKASDFINSTVLSQEEKELLELIVNFRLPLVKDEVCFAEILDDIEVEFSDEEKKRHQSIDKALLEKKLDELKKQIEEFYRKAEYDHSFGNLYGALKWHMHRAAERAEELLDQPLEDNVIVDIPVLGEFISGEGESKPKVVIYYENIQKVVKDIIWIYASWQVMPAVFVHEMFHAWNYFKARRNSRSVLAIDEPMVEFETLYFLKKLYDYTVLQSHHLHKEVESVREKYKDLVLDKQRSIGDMAAYGFGHYLFENLNDDDSIKWIETYSEKSASIDARNEYVKKAEEAFIPVYPFQSEKDVMELFEKIIFDSRAITVTAEKSDAPKTGSHVSLRDLVLACIETIGRKYFEAKELYAFAPIFKACMPHCPNIEEALKQELHELVKEHLLDTLPDDCYCVKLD